MKHTKYVLGLLAFVLAFGMAATGCKSDDDGGGGGTFTLTDIAGTYEDWYAFVTPGGESTQTPAGKYIMGAAAVSSDGMTGVKITGGTVVIPLWVGTQAGVEGRYTGNDTVQELRVRVSQSATNAGSGHNFDFTNVTFSSGSVSKAASASTQSDS